MGALPKPDFYTVCQLACQESKCNSTSLVIYFYMYEGFYSGQRFGLSFARVKERRTSTSSILMLPEGVDDTGNGTKVILTPNCRVKTEKVCVLVVSTA
jgi:hypothetical protein